jgi:hypothetical protein
MRRTLLARVDDAGKPSVRPHPEMHTGPIGAGLTARRTTTDPTIPDFTDLFDPPNVYGYIIHTSWFGPVVTLLSESLTHRTVISLHTRRSLESTVTTGPKVDSDQCLQGFSSGRFSKKIRPDPARNP